MNLPQYWYSASPVSSCSQRIHALGLNYHVGEEAQTKLDLQGSCILNDCLYPPSTSVVFLRAISAIRPSFGQYRGGSLTHPMLITAFLHFRSEGQREPRNVQHQ